MKRRTRRQIVAGVAIGILLGWCATALAQSVAGNASLSVGSSSSNIQLPQSTNPNGGYPALLLEYGVGASSQEIFYQLGTSNSVAAVLPSLPTTQGSPALPANGICVNPGPNNWLAAISVSGSPILRATQLSACPPR